MAPTAEDVTRDISACMEMAVDVDGGVMVDLDDWWLLDRKINGNVITLTYTDEEDPLVEHPNVRVFTVEVTEAE